MTAEEKNSSGYKAKGENQPLVNIPLERCTLGIDIIHPELKSLTSVSEVCDTGCEGRKPINKIRRTDYLAVFDR